MAVGPAQAIRQDAACGFRTVAELARSLGLSELSMGMSADFELAVAEGATIDPSRPRPVRAASWGRCPSGGCDRANLIRATADQRQFMRERSARCP